jgi:hypothetical protein
MEILYVISTQNYGGQDGNGADYCTTTSVFLIRIILSMPCLNDTPVDA